ncbi:hypothetical protein SMICM304S_06950 [Streptomyces microflavus]
MRNGCRLTAQDRQLARFELSLEATRRPELRADLQDGGPRGNVLARATTLLASLGAPRPEQSAELLVAWTDGLLYDRLAGAPAASRPAPDVTELTSVVRRMLAAVLSAEVRARGGTPAVLVGLVAGSASAKAYECGDVNVRRSTVPPRSGAAPPDPRGTHSPNRLSSTLQNLR